MKHIRTFESFRNSKGLKVNEELLGGIINFFKNMWNKAIEEIKKLGENPTDDQLQEWIDKNPLNPSDDSYLLKGVMDDFSKKTDVNQQACLDLIKNILDPQIGSLGKQGMQTLYDGLLKTFGKDLPTVDIVRFYMETIRNRAIKDYKYAGGPDLKVGTDAKVDDKKVIVDMKDQTHLPDFKKVIIAAGEDVKKMKQSAIDWINKTLVPRLDKYLSEIKDEQVDAYIKSLGKELPEGETGSGIVLDWGDVEIEVAELSEEEKKKNPGYYKIIKSGSKKIVLKDGETVLAKISGEAKKGTEIKLTDILRNGSPDAALKDGYTTGKLQRIVSDGKEVDSYKFEGVEKAEGQDDLVKTLSDVKSKNPDAIKKLSDIAKLYGDPDTNKDKIAEIEKQLGVEQK